MNVKNVLQDIMNVANGRDVWIDMESSLRSVVKTRNGAGEGGDDEKDIFDLGPFLAQMLQSPGPAFESSMYRGGAARSARPKASFLSSASAGADTAPPSSWPTVLCNIPLVRMTSRYTPLG